MLNSKSEIDIEAFLKYRCNFARIFVQCWLQPKVNAGLLYLLSQHYMQEESKLTPNRFQHRALGSLLRQVTGAHRRGTLCSKCSILVLRRNSLPSSLLNHLLSDITQSNHTNRLPHTQTYSRSHTAVQTLHTARAINIPESVADRHFLWAIWVLLLGLHFHAHDFNWLVPGG